MTETHFRWHFWPFQINKKLFFKYFLQNGHRRPFWMSEIHFRSHFWPFQIDMQLQFFWKFLTKWLPSAVLDVRNSLLIAFLAILDQYGILFFFGNFFTKWGRRRTFWMFENHFWLHFWPFQIYRPFWMSENHFRLHFCPFPIDQPFWMSENHFRSHFWPFQIDTQLFYYFFILTKWLPAVTAVTDISRPCQPE